MPDPAEELGSIAQRLVTTREAAALTSMREDEFLSLMGRLGVPSQYMVWRGSRRVAVRLPDLIKVAAARLAPPRSTATGNEEELEARVERLTFELDVMRSVHGNTRARTAQLDVELKSRMAEIQRLTADLEIERAESEANITRRLELIEARTLLGANRARLSATETLMHECRRDLEAAREELAQAEGRLDAEQRRRSADQLAFSRERTALDKKLEKREKEIESLRRLLLASRANQVELKRRLTACERVESATASYCDRLEARLIELGEERPRGRIVPPPAQ